MITDKYKNALKGETHMRINQVEELVGITKKNIRFYEEKGLLTPQRNTENGYREYSEEDVKILQKIKLLRKLSIPIEEILKLLKGYHTLDDCMKRHIIVLEREAENVKQRISVCRQLELSGEQIFNVDTEKYISLMKEMEREGVRFMSVEHVDKKRKAPVIAAAVMILLMILVMVFFGWAAKVDPIPFPILLIIMAIPVAVIVGVLLALKDRMKQIEGGEENEARKY